MNGRIKTMEPQGLIPIDPSSGLYLQPYRGSDTDADPLRFAGVFRDTWRQIPRHDRRRIEAYWSDARQGGAKPGDFPAVILQDCLVARGVLAACRLNGYQLDFDTTTMCISPANYVAWYVADVLARVLRFAQGEAQESIAKAAKETVRRGGLKMTIDRFVEGEHGPVKEVLRTWGLPTDPPKLFPELS
jgi:hypothetical protein